MKWAKSLKIQVNESVEERLLNILSHLAKDDPKTKCNILFIEATGPRGSALTQELNEIDQKEIQLEDLITLLKEDGQIIDLHLFINAQNTFEVYIIEGYALDILGNGPELPLSVIGEHTQADLSNYNGG